MNIRKQSILICMKHNGIITLSTGNESVCIIDGELPCTEYSVQTQHHFQSEMGFLSLFEH